MKKLSVIFYVLAVLLSDIMVFVVTREYCNIYWGVRYLGYTVSPNIAFIYVIPFGVAIIVCVVLAVVCKNLSKRGGEK